MNTYDFVHLVLLAFDGTIQGRTKLQKTVYFVGALIDANWNLGFRPYFYGPYSGEVTAAVNELQGLGFLQQISASAGVADPNGFEITRYDYSLTPDGQQIAREKAEKYTEEWKQIQDAAEVLKSMPHNGYVELSIAAKMLYLLRERGAASIDELVKLTPKLGWNVTIAQMHEARELLQTLRLISFEGHVTRDIPQLDK